MRIRIRNWPQKSDRSRPKSAEGLARFTHRAAAGLPLNPRCPRSIRMSSNSDPSSPLMILVAGPYRSGTNDDPVLIARNARAMTEDIPALL